MKLQRRLLIRIRRAIRRQLAMKSDRSTLRAIEEWSGHCPPPNPIDPMKFPFRLILLLVGAALALFAFTSCTDMPVSIGIEGQHGVYSYGSKSGLSIRAKIREEKSGRISAGEIERRWKP